MRSKTRGNDISGIEVTNIAPNGIWVLARGEELLLPYETFPWFKRATVEAILNVEEPTPGHFHWPDLDIDLGLESMRHPERFPLTYTEEA
jgi:hypothetical protein